VGKLRKITGAQGQIDAMNESASQQIAAAKSAAAAQVQALNASAKAAADAQAAAQARDRVEQAAADAVSKPLEVADVALDPQVAGSIAGVRRKRRAQFGTGTAATGVSI